jgi:hypothetical protein
MAPVGSGSANEIVNHDASIDVATLFLSGQRTIAGHEKTVCHLRETQMAYGIKQMSFRELNGES